MKVLQVILILTGTVAFVLGSSAEEGIEDVQVKDLSKPENHQSRIVKGELAEDCDVPYIVFLRIISKQGTESSCSGTIIGNEWILTAAHCIIDARSVTILYGTTNRNTSRHTETVSANSIITHKLYGRLTRINDVALIRTPAVQFSSCINKIDLVPHLWSDYFKEHLTCGWGQKSMTSQPSMQLRCAKVNVILPEACSILNIAIARFFVCAKSVCLGDEGSPMIKGDGYQKLLVGIVSKINPYDCDTMPSAFTAIALHRLWIRSKSGI